MSAGLPRGQTQMLAREARQSCGDAGPAFHGVAEILRRKAIYDEEQARADGLYAAFCAILNGIARNLTQEHTKVAG